ncbi:MAG: competence/damage-inducible protein A [Pseudomonadota bacterium]
MSEQRIWTAGLVVIGDEILSGRTVEANLSYLARWLNSHGVRLREGRIVADEEADIIAAVNALRARYDYVFTTGGIGPTHDDITAAAIAKAFGVPLTPQPQAVALLNAYYGDKITPRRLRMALMPEGASLVPNKSAGAPGFRIGNVIVLAGIPAVMRAMLESLSETIAGGAPVLSRTIAAYVAESEIAPVLEAVQAAHKAVMLGSYPSFKGGRVGAAFVLRGTDEAAIERAAQDLVARIRAHGIEPIMGEL